MDTGLNKVLLLGIGETGLNVVRIIADNNVKGIATFGIKNESEIEMLTGEVTEEVELVLLVADLGNNKENSLALKAATSTKRSGRALAAILTTPRLFEGEKAVIRALEVAREINDEADSSLIINKETFNRPTEKGCTFVELINSLVSVEETIAEGIQDIISLISEKGTIKIDVEELEIALSKSGTFTIGSGIGAGENRVGLAIEQALSSPLMKKCDISTARRVLIKVFVPKNSPLMMNEMKAITAFIETLPSYADVKWGVGESDDDDILSVIFLASGFDVKLPD